MAKKIRSKRHCEKIYIYGTPVVEPHHDGTPHWDMLIFTKDTHRGVARAMVREYALHLL